MGHKWGAYIAMRAFATMAHLFGFALLILLYVNICVKVTILTFLRKRYLCSYTDTSLDGLNWSERLLNNTYNI